MFLEVPPKPFVPFKLVCVLGRVDFESLWNIGIDDGDAVDHNVQEPRFVRFPSVVKSGPHQLRFLLTQDRHPVVGLHPAKRDVIAGRSQGEQRKFAVLYFSFLNAQDVWFLPLQPIEYDRQTFTQRVGVKGRDFHGSPRLNRRGC